MESETPLLAPLLEPRDESLDCGVQKECERGYWGAWEAMKEQHAVIAEMPFAVAAAHPIANLAWLAASGRHGTAELNRAWHTTARILREEGTPHLVSTCLSCGSSHPLQYNSATGEAPVQADFHKYPFDYTPSIILEVISDLVIVLNLCPEDIHKALVKASATIPPKCEKQMQTMEPNVCMLSNQDVQTVDGELQDAPMQDFPRD